MAMKTYDREINSVGAYETYLDWLDTHISLEKGRVLVKFGDEYVIQTSECKTPTRVLIEAFTLRSYLEANEPHVNASYVAKKFIQLVRKPLKLPHNLADMFEELSNSLIVKPKEDERKVIIEPGAKSGAV